MENISHSVFSNASTLTTVPIIHSTNKNNYGHLIKNTTPTPLQLKHRAKREGNPPPIPAPAHPVSHQQSHEFKTASLLCKKQGYSLSSHSKLNGTGGGLYDYFCLPDKLANQTNIVTVSEALEFCDEIGNELIRLKLTTKEEDVKRYKAFCTNCLANIVIHGNATEISNLKNFLNNNSELNGIDLERVKDFLSSKDVAKKIIKHHSVVYSVSSRLFGRFNSVIAFCALALYTAYIRNYSFNG